MMKIIVFCATVFILISCKKNPNYFSENNIFHQTIDDSLELNAQPIISDAYGIGNIVPVGNYLVALLREGENLIYVYNNSGSFIGSYGHRGRAANELIGIGLNRQRQGSIVYANDVNGQRIVAIDIDSTIKADSFVITKSYSTVQYAVNSFVYQDSMIIAMQQTPNNYLLKVTKNNDIVDSQNLYKPVDNAYGNYYSPTAISPDSKKIGWAMRGINQINILDLATNERKSVSVYREPQVGDIIIDEQTSLPVHIYYCDMDVTDSYIYALYMDQVAPEAGVVPKAMEIHILNWDGVVIKKIKIDEYLFCIVVDEQLGLIYGIGHDEVVYKYNFVI